MNHIMITGGGSGLGLGMARRYLKRGISVSVLDLLVSNENQNLLTQAANEGGSHWAFFQMDITDDVAVEKAVAAAVQKFDTPDLAINSAGVAINKTLADMKPAEFRKVIDINLNGSLHFASAIAPHLEPRIASGAGGFPGRYYQQLWLQCLRRVQVWCAGSGHHIALRIRTTGYSPQLYLPARGAYATGGQGAP